MKFKNTEEKNLYEFFKEWYNDVEGIGYPSTFDELWKDIKEGKL